MPGSARLNGLGSARSPRFCRGREFLGPTLFRTRRMEPFELCWRTSCLRVDFAQISCARDAARRVSNIFSGRRPDACRFPAASTRALPRPSTKAGVARPSNQFRDAQRSFRCRRRCCCEAARATSHRSASGSFQPLWRCRYWRRAAMRSAKACGRFDSRGRGPIRRLAGLH